MFKEFTTSVPAATPFAQWIKPLYLNKLTLFNESDTQQSSTDKPVALEFLIELEYRNIGFWGGRKTGEPGEKLSEQGREPTTNSTHIWRRVRESNTGHIGGRWALSPLRYPCSP